jgi:probable HAF family extracellular repeat protein
MRSNNEAIVAPAIPHGEALMRTGRMIIALAAMAAATLPADVRSAAPQYVGVRLGTLGGTSASSSAINAHGDVVGSSRTTGDVAVHGFLHVGGSMVDIGVVGGDSCSIANDVNDQGQVVGVSDFACEANNRPSLFVNGTHSYLFGLFVFGQAAAINNAGQIVGWSGSTSGPIAFLLSGGATTDLGTLGGRDSFAYAINDRAEIVGDSATAFPTLAVPFPPTHAFLYASGAMTDLGTLGGTYSAARSINNRGEIAGHAATADAQMHAFVHANGVMKDLGTLGGATSLAFGINDAGWVVGRSLAPGDVEWRAFLHADGAMHDINALLQNDLGGDKIDIAYAINDRGQIAATSCDPRSGRCVAYRLDPVPVAARAQEIPALSPSMLLALSIAIGATLLAARSA